MRGAKRGLEAGLTGNRPWSFPQFDCKRKKSKCRLLLRGRSHNQLTVQGKPKSPTNSGDISAQVRRTELKINKDQLHDPRFLCQPLFLKKVQSISFEYFRQTGLIKNWIWSRLRRLKGHLHFTVRPKQIGTTLDFSWQNPGVSEIEFSFLLGF